MQIYKFILLDFQVVILEFNSFLIVLVTYLFINVYRNEL